MFITWDILDTTRMFADKNSYNSYFSSSLSEPQYYSIWEADTMIGGFSYTESPTMFKYELSNDTLYLKDVESVPINDITDLYYTGKTITYALRVDTNFCDISKEAYGYLPIWINLPLSEEVVTMHKILTDLMLVSDMNVGHPKSYIKEHPKDTFLLQVYDVFITYNQVSQFIEEERAKLPEVQKDSLIISLAVDRNTPAIVVDRIERIIHASYPTVDIYYACLPEGKPKMHKPIFTSLKNEFAKSADKPAVFLTFSVGADKQIDWTVQKHTQKAELQRYRLQTSEERDRLKATILQAKQNNQLLGIRFNFTTDATFQDYITAQTTIKLMIEETLQ